MDSSLEKESVGIKHKRKKFWVCEGCSYDHGKCIIFSRHKPCKCIFDEETSLLREKGDFFRFCDWFERPWGEGLRSIVSILSFQECEEPDYFCEGDR